MTSVFSSSLPGVDSHNTQHDNTVTSGRTATGETYAVHSIKYTEPTVHRITLPMCVHTTQVMPHYGNMADAWDRPIQSAELPCKGKILKFCSARMLQLLHI